MHRRIFAHGSLLSLTLLLSLTVVVGGSGCRVVSTYVANRIHDFTDPVDVGLGSGFGIRVQTTNFLQTGFLVKQGVSVDGIGVGHGGQGFQHDSIRYNERNGL